MSASVNKVRVSENWMQKTGEEQSETAVEGRSESGQGNIFCQLAE